MKYFGLAISDVAMNLDRNAGADIVVSGKDGIAVVFTKPSFSLARNVKFSFDNGEFNRDNPKIRVLSPKTTEKLEICMSIKTNVKDMNNNGVKALVILDKNKDSGSERWQFGMTNLRQREFTFTRNSKGWYCTGKERLIHFLMTLSKIYYGLGV